jgi:pimeloyl-ACP methyl ester carboxylesterase
MPTDRTHIVLVPGFAGFDALGQLEYYAGITEQFRLWKKPHHKATLNYFDNFPTAAVATRAKRLRHFLAERIARGEFAEDDQIVLIGHSTGGLDIRRLLLDLGQDKANHASYAVDRLTITAEQILRMLQRVVFISVPQYGTNIANWVRHHSILREVAVTELQASVALSQLPLINRLQGLLSDCTAAVTNIDLVLAARDALIEAEVGSSRDKSRTLLSEEAASELSLWLRHMSADFSAVDDLSVLPASKDAQSPAHFNAATRNKEIEYWDNDKIEIRSYATIGKSPFSFDTGETVPMWELLLPWTFGSTLENLADQMDQVYLHCYRACAGGPFAYPGDANYVPGSGSVPWGEIPTPQAVFPTSAFAGKISLWDNDGIVNTASMLWPNGNETILVPCDHADILGHYKRVPVAIQAEESGRQFEAYDLLKSGSRFSDTEFQEIWSSIFGYCLDGYARDGARKMKGYAKASSESIQAYSSTVEERS